MVSDQIRIDNNEYKVRLDALESNDFEFNNTLKSTNTELKEEIGENNEKFKQLSQDLNVKTASKINEVFHKLDKKIMKVENVIDLSVKPGLTTLQGKVAKSESAVSNLQYETRSNKGEIDSLHSEINSNKGNITNLQSETKSTEGKISNLQSAMERKDYDLFDKYSDLQNSISLLQTKDLEMTEALNNLNETKAEKVRIYLYTM